MNYIKTTLCLLLLFVNKQLFTMDAPLFLSLHQACAEANIEMVKSLLQTGKCNINAVNPVHGTPLHIACTNEQINIAMLLLEQNGINANHKDNKGETPLFTVLRRLQLTEDTINLINCLINSGKVNFNIKNESQETFFYITCSDLFDMYGRNHKAIKKFLHKFSFIHKLTDQEIKIFASQQLHHAAFFLDKDNNDEYIRPFVEFCLYLNADINTRNDKQQRPLDSAYQEYKYACNHLKYNSKDLINKEQTYHTFLQYTPYLPDKELHYILWKKNLAQDICAKIMGFYAALTIDREVINNINNHNSAYYKSTTTSKKRFRKKLLAEKCNHLGYINPSAKKLI